MFKSVLHMLLDTIRLYPEKDVIRHKVNGEYVGISYAEFGESIRDLFYGMHQLGIQPGDKVSILSYNRPEWPLTDFATFAIRGVVVPLYHTLTPTQIAYILNDAGVRVVFVENQAMLEKILPIWEECPSLEFVISYDEVSAGAENIYSYKEIVSKGKEFRKENPALFDETIEQIDPQETCSLVYTSGTTGNPKGVMLHHHGFVTDIIYSEKRLNLRPDDVFISFLPLSHLYERLAGHWCAMYRGCTIGYASDINTVIEDIQEIKPTVMTSVPRLYEKISARVLEQVESGPAFKRRLFYWALRTGRQFHELRYQNKSSAVLTFKYQLADKLVFKKIKQKLGGRFRYPISGGAPISIDTLKFFEAMGMQIIEGYGMTETHLIITLTPFGKIVHGSCGIPIDCLEVKIAEDGEICVKGPTIMKGYYNKPELTREAIDEEGWFHTGDIGHIKDGYVFITDRKKNILVTAGGKNVAPAPIENALKESKYIEDVCLVGDRRKFISALIIPNFEMVEKFAEERNLKFEDRKALVEHPEVKRLFQEELEKYQDGFARYEKAKKFILLSEPLSMENGELTPSLKIRRSVVEKKFKVEIDSLYKEATPFQA